MPRFKKSSPDLVARVVDLIDAIPGSARTQMFGCPVGTLGGNMFIGLFEDHLFVRLPEAERATLIEQFGGRAFEPIPGRPMKEYVVVPHDLTTTDALDVWVERACNYAKSLPSNDPKRRNLR